MDNYHTLNVERRERRPECERCHGTGFMHLEDIAWVEERPIQVADILTWIEFMSLVGEDHRVEVCWCSLRNEL